MDSWCGARRIASPLKANSGLQYEHNKWEKWFGKAGSNSIRSAESNEHVCVSNGLHMGELTWANMDGQVTYQGLTQLFVFSKKIF